MFNCVFLYYRDSTCDCILAHIQKSHFAQLWYQTCHNAQLWYEKGHILNLFQVHTLIFPIITQPSLLHRPHSRRFKLQQRASRRLGCWGMDWLCLWWAGSLVWTQPPPSNTFAVNVSACIMCLSLLVKSLPHLRGHFWWRQQRSVFKRGRTHSLAAVIQQI